MSCIISKKYFNFKPEYLTSKYPIVYISVCFTSIIFSYFQYDLFDQYCSIPIMIFCTCIIGIPHGAIDHLLYYKLKNNITSMNYHEKLDILKSTGSCLNITGKTKLQEENKHEIKQKCWGLEYSDDTGRLIFYGNYMAILAIWGVFWVVIPVPTFYTFLLVSAYHFGESDLDYISMPNIRDNRWMYLSRGILLLGSLITSNTSITNPIIQRMNSQGGAAKKVSEPFFLSQNMNLRKAHH